MGRRLRRARRIRRRRSRARRQATNRADALPNSEPRQRAATASAGHRRQRRAASSFACAPTCSTCASHRKAVIWYARICCSIPSARTFQSPSCVCSNDSGPERWVFQTGLAQCRRRCGAESPRHVPHGEQRVRVGAGPRRARGHARLGGRGTDQRSQDLHLPSRSVRGRFDLDGRADGGRQLARRALRADGARARARRALVLLGRFVFVQRARALRRRSVRQARLRGSRTDARDGERAGRLVRIDSAPFPRGGRAAEHGDLSLRRSDARSGLSPERDRPRRRRQRRGATERHLQAVRRAEAARAIAKRRR